MRLPLFTLAALAACGGEDRPVFAPIIDVPAEGSDAYPYTGLDELVLEIAPAGREGESKTFPIGEPLELPDIDYGEQLVVHLTGRTGGVEVAYGRTCAVDIDAESVEQATHLYFARMVKWGQGPVPGAVDRAPALAYSLPDGSAVFVGEGRVTRFDPGLTGEFSDVEIDSIEPRDGGILAALPDGRAVLIGGTAGEENGVPLVEAIDPNEDPVSASRVEAQPGPRLRNHAAVTLVDGSVLVVGGELQPDAGVFGLSRVAWLVHFGDGNTLDAPEQLVSETIAARADHSLTRLGDDVGAAVLVAGGRDADQQPIATAELYRPLSRAFEPVATAVLATPRWNHRAVRLPDGSVLIIGGRTRDSKGDEIAATQVELYDPVLGVFKDPEASLGSTNAVEDMAVVPMPDGRVLLIGGRDKDGKPVATVLIARFDPVDGTVDLSVTDPLEAPRAGHSAAVLCDGTILVAGGGAGSERYNPPSAGRR